MGNISQLAFEMIMVAQFSKEFCCDEAQYFKISGEAEMPMAVLPLLPPLTHRYHRGGGGGGEVAVGFVGDQCKNECF